MSTRRPPPSDCFLGIDVGTSGTKVLAIAADGSVRASASCPHVLRTPRPGWVEQDPDDWWRAAQVAVRAVIERLPGGARDVAAVGLAGHMSSVVAVGSDGHAVRPCIMLSDTRASAEAAWLDERFGERIELLCGGRPSAAAVAPRLLWLKRHEPETYGRTASFVFAKDYVRLRLTGRLASEPTDAGNTMLLDLASGRWDEALCSAIGLDPAQLPDLMPTTGVVGGVTDGAAAATGMRAGTPVIAGSADMAAAVTGSRAVVPGVVAITIGTAAPVTTSFHALPSGARGRVTFHPHAMPGWLYAIGSVFSGGLSLHWIARALGDEALLEEDAAGCYERLSAEAGTAPPGSDGALFLPFLVGSGSPEFDGAMRGTFVGLSLATDRARMVRAVMEGVAFNVRECVDAFRDLGAPVDRVHVGGGGAASTTWRAILAGVLGMPVHPVAVREVSALGAAALAAVGLGAFSDVPAASGALVHFEEPVTPDDGAMATYEGTYRGYVEARRSLGEVYRSMTGQEGSRRMG